MLLVVVFCWSSAFAQRGGRNTAIKLKPVTKTFALTKAKIITKPGEVIENGTIIIKDGLIQAIGKDLKVPAEAKVINADSMFVYAGFIDGLSHTGIPEPKASNSRPNIPDPGNPTNEQAGIQPERAAIDLLSVSDKSIAEMRKIGFTTAHVVPRGRMLPGQGAIINLQGEESKDMVIAAPSSLFSQFRGSGQRAYPSTIIAVMAVYRDLFNQSMQAKAHSEAYEKDASGMNRPERDPVLEAFFPVLNGQQYNFFHAPDVKSIYRALTLQKEFSFPLALANVKEGWRMMDKFKSGNTLVFLSLDLPKEVKSKKEEDKEVSENMKMFEEKRAKAMAELVGQAAEFEKAGISFGFSAASVNSKDIKKNLQRMIKAGLSEETALKALTTTPALLLGLSNMMGTVEQGKIANLVVTDKPYFDEKSNVRYVFVDGNLHEYEAPKRKAASKKGNAPTTAEAGLTAEKLAGAWSFKVNVPGQQSSGTLIIENNNGNLDGVMKSSQMGSVDINEIEIDGDQILFSVPISFGGQDLVLDYELTVDGDSLSGIVAVGDFGEFDVEGQRTDDPRKEGERR